MLVNSTIDPTILDDVSPYSCSAQLNHGDSILMTLPPPDDSVHIPYVELCAPVYLVLPPTPPSSPVLVGLDVAAPTLALLADAFEWQMSLRAHSRTLYSYSLVGDILAACNTVDCSFEC